MSGSVGVARPPPVRPGEEEEREAVFQLLDKMEAFKVEGRDKRGRRILRIIGKFFPARIVKPAVLIRYLEERVFPDLLGKKEKGAPFVGVYVHTYVQRLENFPGVSELRRLRWRSSPDLRWRRLLDIRQQPQATCGRGLISKEHGADAAEEEHEKAAKDARSALSVSLDDRRRRHEMTLRTKAASQGRVIGAALGSPSISSDILRSSRKSSLSRQASGTSRRCPSQEYTTKQPFFDAGVLEQASAATSVASPFPWKAILSLPAAAALCQFLAIWAILPELIMVSDW